MKERQIDEQAPVQSADIGLRKLSFGSSILSHSPPGFHVNLLSNSLSNKLRQLRTNSLRSTDEDLFKTRSKPPRQPHRIKTTGASKSILSRHGKPNLVEPHSHVGSTKSSAKADSVRAAGNHQQLSRCPSVNSVASDKLLHLSFRIKASKTDSRRSNSAGQLRSQSSQTLTERAQSELTYTRRDTPCSAFSFKFPGVDRTVKVIKQGGVFKPVDKYAPGRQDLRDMGNLSQRAFCDYDLYVLPLCGDENSVPVPVDMVSPRGYQDSGKKRIKVSWDVVHGGQPEAGLAVDGTESRLGGNPTPSTPSNNQRAVSTDYFAYRRPIYSSGRSKVDSIGVKWAMPTVAQDEPMKKEKAEPVKPKPMWSWLVMQENKQQIQPQKTRGAVSTPAQTAHSGPASTNSTVVDVRTRHSRDVHPVSTAMNREGTSVSKPKWTVPSSNASTLDAERAFMSHMEFVKRPRAHILQDHARTWHEQQRRPEIPGGRICSD